MVMQNNVNITFGTEALLRFTKELQAKDYSSLFLLVDNHTQEFCLPRFVSQTGLTQLEVLVMEAGEEHKTLQTCENLWLWPVLLNGESIFTTSPLPCSRWSMLLWEERRVLI